MTAQRNTRVLLARRPQGMPVPEDFEVVDAPLPPLQAGQILIRNHYLSMDAGFRYWMNEGSGDGYLPSMPLGAPVMSLTLGQVEASKHPGFQAGDRVMGRLAWETFSISDHSDFLTRLPEQLAFPLNYYAGILGGTGMTAYFGVMDIARPRPGEVAVISGAAGAVGTVAGQLTRLHGATTIGLAGNDEKCRYLTEELGFDHAINYRKASSLRNAVSELAPQGIDIYFDNVGGQILNDMLHLVRDHARVPLCGAVSTYNDSAPPPGPDNLFEMVTKRVTLQGFMYTDCESRYPEALAALSGWLQQGQLQNVEYQLQGVDQAGVAFCDMLSGKNLGKTLVRV